ncbi:MAG: hypothetical protein HC875_16700 [Anaerolineales bacterium]|nr:hypothetical protein [Anaerolineales bacterium]
MDQRPVLIKDNQGRLDGGQGWNKVGHVWTILSYFRSTSAISRDAL